MRYLLIIAVVYFVFKSLGKLLVNMKIVDRDTAEINDEQSVRNTRLHVDESEIEDADFKDVE